MPLFADRLAGDPVHEFLDAASEQLQLLADDPWTEPDGAGLEYLDAIGAAIAHVRSRVAQADPLLVTPMMLRSLGGPADGLATHLREFNSSRSEATAQAAYQQAESMLGAAASFPPQFLGTPDQALETALSELRREAASLQSGFSAQIEAARTQLDSRIAGVEERVTESSSKAEDLSVQIATVTETFQARTAELETARSQALQQIQESLRSITTTFNEGQTTRTEAFNERQSEREVAATTLIQKAQADLEQLQSRLDERENEARRVLAVAPT